MSNTDTGRAPSGQALAVPVEPASSLAASRFDPSRDHLLTETNKLGESLRPGHYLSRWEQGNHPYGCPDRCPFCHAEQNYTELWYNGPGSPPSYSVCCGSCGAQGPTSHGRFKGDHYGACLDAVALWNCSRDSDGNLKGEGA